MTLSFTRVTPEELDRALEDPELAWELVDDENRPYCFLEKTWAGIQFLLHAAGVDVDVLGDGDPIDEESTMFGWHDRLVAASARTLSATPFDVLAEHYDSRKLSEEEVYPMKHLWDDDDDLEYLRSHYGDLVTFFEETAASGGAAIRYFSV